jgi:hypothetical protein
MRIYAKTEECRHQKMVFFPDTEFTLLNSESDSLELTAFGKQFICLLKFKEFSWVGALVILREAVSNRRLSLIKHVLSLDLGISQVSDQGEGNGVGLYIVQRNSCSHAHFTHEEFRSDWLGMLILEEFEGGFFGICSGLLRAAMRYGRSLY